MTNRVLPPYQGVEGWNCNSPWVVVSHSHLHQTSPMITTTPLIHIIQSPHWKIHQSYKQYRTHELIHQKIHKKNSQHNPQPYHRWLHHHPRPTTLMPHHYISTHHQNHLPKSHPKLKEKQPPGKTRPPTQKLPHQNLQRRCFSFHPIGIYVPISAFEDKGHMLCISKMFAFKPSKDLRITVQQKEDKEICNLYLIQQAGKEEKKKKKRKKKKVDAGFHCCCKCHIASLFSYFSPSKKKKKISTSAGH